MREMLGVALSLVLALAGEPAAASSGEAETLVSLDVKDAEITQIVRVLSEAAGLQVVFDPGLACRLTLKLREAPWRSAFDASLRACALGSEQEGQVLRIAPVARLADEAQAERRLREQQELGRPLRMTTFRLSYARAQEMAPLLKSLLSPPGDVVYDTRTNTLIILN